MTKPSIERLTHIGLHVKDLDVSLSFYRDVLGLHVTDDDREHNLVFLSSHPDDEHHEVLLTSGRNVPIEGKLIQQIAFRCKALSDVIAYWQRFVDRGVKILYTITHGNSISCYFFDPDDNICEVYWQTGLKARQGYLIGLDFALSEAEILRQVQKSVAAHGTTGIVDLTMLKAQKLD